ncbi:MAG: hypothetical protein MJ147_02210 [Clostridia bacterium]|nr:hypothetical protein [Clostridia bacterium]
MEILTEADLRSGRIVSTNGRVIVSEKTFITPLAKEFIRDNHIEVIYNDKKESAGSFGKGVMSYTPIPKSGSNRFVDYETGEGYEEKPEHMTHMRDNLLVPKNHPRILFRGKLDSLQALIMQTQITALDDGYKNIAEELDEVMAFVQILLGCEVKDEPVPEIKIFGMNSQRLRYVSHHLTEEFGIQHSIPHYSMGKVCVALNTLRTFIRETELSAVNAFTKDDKMLRSDIVEALNRLSSCVYIIFCKKVAGQYD